ncbi:Major facilitator superfamily domain-containing protein 4A [Halotydeus destructor]|nr:Major facilitator superfamily domain-containing protein 4A [Halotydeus destructor]
MAENSSERKFKTLSVYGSFLCLAMVYNILGPTILELQCAIEVSYEQITKVLLARSSGYAVGSLLVGLLYDRLNPMLTFSFTLAIMGICAILIPFSSSFFIVLSVTFVGFIGGGMIDSASHVFMLYLWGRESQSYMQTLHSFYGVGSLVAPLLASPFLSISKEEPRTVTKNSTSQCGQEESHIYIPYAAMGVLCIILASVFLYLYCFRRQTDEHCSRQVEQHDSTDGQKDSPWPKRTVIVIAGMLMFAVLGLEIGMGSFITSFAVKSDLHLTSRAGAFMTSAYWFTFTFARILAIGCVDKISIYLNITIELVVLLAANIFLIPFGNSVEWCLLVGVALVGVGISTLWAAVFSLLENHFPVKSGTGSFLIISACIGELIFPLILAYALETSPQAFLWTIFACTVMCCIIFGALCIALRRIVRSVDSTSANQSPISAHKNYGAILADRALESETKNSKQHDGGTQKKSEHEVEP